MMKIPVAKPYLTPEEAQRAFETILSGWVTQGPSVAEFERKFAAYTGAQHAVAVSNCTTALHLAWLALGIAPGDEVICPSMSYIATANSIVHAGATPVFAEIDPATFNLSLQDVERRITPRTRAILLVHQIGIPADIEGFQALCKRRGLKLVEDAACAAGSSYHNAKIGSHSDLVCFSFHPRKVITTGDGGMITTSKTEFDTRLRLLRQHGMSVSDKVRHDSTTVVIEEHLEVGYNYRMTDIQAAVGIAQLEKLDWIVAERRKIAAKYEEAFSGIQGIRLLREPQGTHWNYQSFPLVLEGGAAARRNAFMQELLDRGISTRRGIMTAHREPAYVSRGPQPRLPISERVSDESLILPLYVPMSDAEVSQVVQEVRDLLQKER